MVGWIVNKCFWERVLAVYCVCVMEREMAFASVISLKNTIERVVNSSHFALVPPSNEMLQTAYEELELLQEHLKRLDSTSKRMCRKAVDALDAQIGDGVTRFEGLLESSLSDLIEENHPLTFSIDLQHLRQDVESFVAAVKKMEDDYNRALDNLLPEEADDHGTSAADDFCVSNTKMVGLSDLFIEIRDLFTRPKIQIFIVFTLTGMAGIGKTTLAKKIFDDPLVSSHFQCRVWVTVGRKCRVNEIPRRILAQVLDPDMDKPHVEEDEKVAQSVYQVLEDKRYLVVLDDVWEGEVWDYLENCFPKNEYGVIFFSTRLKQVREHVNYFPQSTMRFLNKEESWDLLREMVFDHGLCPFRFESVGKKIAENCEGLPLLIVKVAHLLSKEERTVEYWKKIAASKQNSIFINAYDQILDVLYPSYIYLPQRLKPFFLYMGVFPQDCEIYQSNLINMLIAEGLLEQNETETLEECAAKCLKELVSNRLVNVCQENILTFSREIKTCRLHSVWWHLCKIEAGRNKFFHVINSLAHGFERRLKGQRRVCFHNNILLGIKDVHNAIEVDCASTARSLLCFGPYHQYPVPICFGLRFLKVLNALTIRLFEFPMEVVKLVQLRYLALTYNGNLPASVSKLYNLECLIIHRHLSIVSNVFTSFVPVEIWDMQELKHLQIMGGNLPRPNDHALFGNLQILLDVSAHSLTKGVLRKISNVKKLRIQVVLVPDDEDSKPFRCLNRVSRLQKLESLKCIIVNPEIMAEVVAPPAPLSMFPSSLKKLHLSGLGYPWQYMSILGSLPHLQLLKLHHYAFQGPNWEVKEFEFTSLRFLEIEDTDLVQWNVGSGSFQRLRHLHINHCYYLEEFHWDFDYYFKEVQVVDSNPLAATFLNQIKDRRGRRFLDVRYHSSWEDRKLNS